MWEIKLKKKKRTSVTRSSEGNQKQFELAGVRVKGVDRKIQFTILKIYFVSTSVYRHAVQIQRIFYQGK